VAPSPPLCRAQHGGLHIAIRFTDIIMSLRLDCPAALSLNARLLGGAEAVLKRAICLLVGAVTIVNARLAEAKCGDQYAGPIANNPAYLFSSSCKMTAGNHIELRNEVCSVTAGGLPFFWEKLNWVSGSQGIQSGKCLLFANSSNTANMIDAPDSTIHLYGDLKKTETTNVFLSGYAASQDEIEKSIARKALQEGGTVAPFQFKISFAAHGSNQVSIRATIHANDPIFYIYLPSNVKNEDDLAAFIAPEYLDKIKAYVSFNDTNDRVGAQRSDQVIADYRQRNELSGRTRVSRIVSGDSAEIAFDVNAKLSDIASSVKVCVGEFKTVVTCL
jgi:hypothetical protein